MITKTPEQIAEQAASKVIADNLDNMGEDYNPEGDPIAQLAWELGEGIEYEDGLKQLAAAAIEADRAQRQPADVEITLPPEDDTPGGVAETLRQIADLIDQGFTSGYHPAWNLNKEL